MSDIMKGEEEQADSSKVKDHKSPPPCGCCSLGWTAKTSRKVTHSIMDFVGNTPIVKLNKIPKDYGLSCEIFAKCEYMNPGGSIKDRIARSMIAAAEGQGRVRAGTVFVEPTSGNTGIGIAFAATQTGHKCIIVTEEKNSSEKVNTLRLLGAEVIQTKNNSGELEVSRKIRDSDPVNNLMLDQITNSIELNIQCFAQFDNDVNPLTHYECTGLEIVDALGAVHALVLGAGTGGTLSGAGRRLKRVCPGCLVVVAEPDGSSMILKHKKYQPFRVEGIGGSWKPAVFDESIIDHVEVTSDGDSFLMAREMAFKEGLLCGGSSGAAMVAAVRAAKKLNLGAGKRVVVILPDGIRNYMNKFVNDQWMESHLFMDPPEHTMEWWNLPITDLKYKHKPLIIDENYTCAQAVDKMNKKNINAAAIINKQGCFVGAVSKDSFRYSSTNPTKLPNLDSQIMDYNDPVAHHLVKHCHTMAKNGKKGMPTIGRLARVLDITPFVVIGTRKLINDNECFIPDAIATTDEVFDNIYLFSKKT